MDSLSSRLKPLMPFFHPLPPPQKKYENARLYSKLLALLQVFCCHFQSVSNGSPLDGQDSHSISADGHIFLPDYPGNSFLTIFLT
jgi:hypothetical protein